MLDQVLKLFDIEPEFDLDIMKHGQLISDVTVAILVGLQPVLEDFKPDVVLVHGDTATTFAASLAAFYKKIAIGHVEAGLRTGNLYSPWPEEANRKLTSVLVKYHFAPTVGAKNNLLTEGVPERDIFVTGNTVIDSLFWTTDLLQSDPSILSEMQEQFNFLDFKKRCILVTGHRRESFGGFERICLALKAIAINHPDIQIVYPVHLNPNAGAGEEIPSILDNVFLIQPLDYLPFTYLMSRAYIILTDSVFKKKHHH